MPRPVAEQRDECDFSERSLNQLGYRFLNQDDLANAIELFKFIVELYPASANATTRGGANPVEIQEIGREYVIYIPSSRSVGSMTAADWERVGIKPDIEVEAAQALMVAHLEAIKALSAKSGDENDKFLYQWTFDGIKAKNHPFPVNPALFQFYTGVYGDRIIGIHHDELYFRRGERAKMKMIAMAENLFMIENLDYLRLRFVKEKDGTVSLESLYDDGRVVNSRRKNELY